MDDTILETSRLRLRYFRKDDIPFAVALWMDPEMTKHTGGPRDREFLEREFARTAEDPRLEEYDLWTVTLSGTGEPVGQAGFIPKEIEGESFIELSYFIDREYQGKGYATEISRALIARAFGIGRLSSLIAIIGPENGPSIAVAEAVGMRFWKEETRNGSRKLVYRIDAVAYRPELSALGFDRWLGKTGASDASSDLGSGEFEIGRISAELKERYAILSAQGEFDAEVTGNLRYGASSREDFPATGDWVRFKPYQGGFAVIHSVLPRYSILRRRDPKGDGSAQVIAANIDAAFIVQSAERDFNANRLERYLAICHEAGIRPIAVISKTDLVDEAALGEIARAVERLAGKDSIRLVSSRTLSGLEEIRASIEPGLTYCLLGSSGAGKSTLINALAGRDLMATSELSESNGKGRHTTTRRELHILEPGGILVDNPGMREVGVVEVSSGLAAAFPDISRLAEGCRFSDCVHEHEAGCAVLKSLEEGALDPRVYENYRKMRKENEYFTATKAEMHRKMRSFGKSAKIYQRDKRLGKF